MVKIVFALGYIPVPVDIDFSTTAPIKESLLSLINPNVKALLITYVYGVVYNIEEVVNICK